MVEYIVRTDKPIRMDEVLHLHGIHHYSVQRLEKHGRLIDADELEGILDEVNGYGGASEITYKKMIEILHDETLAPVIVEATE